MKLPKNILIEKAMSGDASRPVLGSAHLQRLENQPHQARLVATNGYIAAIVPVLVEDADVAGYVSADAFKAARAADKKSESASMVCNGVCKLTNGMEVARPDLGNYPNIDAVIPKDETKWSVALDPEMLLAVAQAIGSERGVMLEISGDGKAIRVKPQNNPRAKNARGKTVDFVPACADAFGLIMPIQNK